MTVPKFRLVITLGRGLETVTFKKEKKDKGKSYPLHQ